ncbi:MAG: class I SAM-dependent methyltransferase [Candidatus Thioglobus sp.]|nr:class I SAM-dependent methyltransferase [Candidatus Thioglobus sp.]
MKNTKSMISTIYQTLHAADLQELEGIYKDWASDYDHDVVELAGYVGHLITSSLLLSKLKNKKARILDAGCGTGLVGEILSQNSFNNIEGVDFSQEMLNEATQKQIYQSLRLVDLTKNLDYEGNLFDAIVCAGTFTCGHVGPEALREMVRITKKGGYICFTVRKQEWEASPYKTIIDDLESSDFWHPVVHKTADYNVKEGVTCQLCLYQVN